MSTQDEIRNDLETIKSKSMPRKKKEVSIDSPEITIETEDDRSEFNCPDCQGEGMIFDKIYPEGKLCARCRGTGKI